MLFRLTGVALGVCALATWAPARQDTPQQTAPQQAKQQPSRQPSRSGAQQAPPLVAPPSAARQGPAPEFDSLETFIPFFNRWVEEGDRTDIPWRVEVHDPRLNFDQRLEALVEVELRGGHLNRSGDRHDLLLVMRVADEAGKWYDGYGYYRHPTEGEMPGRLRLVFTMRILFRPGTYRVGVVLYDMDTKLRSVTRRTLRVRPLRNDPLPNAWQSLPPVEFGRAQAGAERYVRGRPPERMVLPVESARPVQIEVLVNLSWTQLTATLQRINVPGASPRMLSMLNVVSQFGLRQGAMNVTAVDLARRQVVFEQAEVERVDWTGFLEALGGINPHTIGFTDLRDSKSNPAFFREVLAERIQRACAAPAAGDNGAQPLRVLMVLSSSMLFERGSDLTPVELPAGCDLRVVHFQSGWEEWDEIQQMIQPLRPQKIRVDRPEQVRRELADLLKQLGS